MPFRLLKFESVEGGVKRVVLEQISRAREELRDPQLERRAAIHQARKRCKKIRGALRLIRPEFDDYAKENAHFRDAARRLAGIRDSDVMIETVEKLIKRVPSKDAETVRRFRGALLNRRRIIASDKADPDQRVEEFLTDLEEAEKRIPDWRIPADEFPAIAKGFLLTYRRGRKALAQAKENPTDAALHDWRKRVKYHWHHVRLLGNAWKPLLKAYRDELKKLSDLLGDLHDLAVLQRTIEREFKDNQSIRALQTTMSAIDRSKKALEAEALRLGERAHAEKPKAIARRFHRYWRAWRHDD